MYIQVVDFSHLDPSHCKVVVQRPHCNNWGTFDRVMSTDVRFKERGTAGLRSCPNDSCRGLIFFHNKGGQITSFPSLKIDFDTKDVPEEILKIFSEAITCHSSECYVASGMMIRKTLEAICEDKGATGNNLHQRLQKLRDIIVMSKELFDALDVLKLLGNDAAHIEAKTFDTIGREEIEISIEFTKEILKAVYQYQGLLGRLNSLKKAN